MKTLGTLATIAAFAAVVAWAMGQQDRIRCQVCVTYRAQTRCKTVAAPTKEDALAAAQGGVCGEISGSMTRDLACMRTPPVSTSCQE